MNGLLQDLRYAVRQLLKSPGFAVTAVLSLTLGIGATTAFFSVVYSILLDPYPYRDADRMVHVELRDKSDRGPLLFVNGSEYEQLRHASSVDDVFLQNGRTQTLTGGQFPISVNVGQYSPNLFAYMGVPPALGREFGPSDAPEGKGTPVTVKLRLRELNPELAVSDVRTLAWWLETQGWGQGRFIATLFSLFAFLALALAAAGLYSVVSFSVTQRTQEVGLRMALGAPRANILRLVISSTAVMLAAGVGVGLALSLALDTLCAPGQAAEVRAIR